MFIDPDGKDIVVPRKKDQKRIVDMINANSTNTYAIDKKGHLYMKEANTNKEGSKYYSEKLNTAIAHKELAQIILYDESDNLPLPGAVKKEDGRIRMKRGGGNGTVSMESLGGGATFAVGVEKSDVLIYVSGKTDEAKDENGKTFTAQPEDILMHEIVGHLLPFFRYSDTGNAVDNENKANKELKKPIRQKNETHTEIPQ
jgi:hypothetical protein